VRFVTGTFFTGDELRSVKPGAPDAAAMGHAADRGRRRQPRRARGAARRTYYVHMNCTNPVLDAASPERARVRRAGVEIADDGWRSSCERDLALEARLRAIGAERYHHRHPFNLRMHAGSSRATSSRAGSPTATTTRRASRSRTA
jgi:hypothetical protein